MQYGAIEAGGTKFICAVGSGPRDVAARRRIETADPGTTLAAVTDFLAGHSVRAIGVASFGPVELRAGHPEYGRITTTPKPGWSGADVVGALAPLGVPVGFDTDVNGAALGEGRWGAARGLSTFAYLTVGTGVGVGAVIGGRVAHGLVHPEVGHVSVSRLPGDDFDGVCPFHGDCFEGMASGPAFHARWGDGELDGAARAAAIETQAHYVAAGLRNVVYAMAPERIVVGGGLSGLAGLLPRVRYYLARQLAGYPRLPEHERDDFVVAAQLGDDAGIAGAFVLAEEAAGG